MVRDSDLLRALLFEAEKQLEGSILPPEEVGQYKDEEQILHHILLLTDAGYMTRQGQWEFRLTNAGHDFIEAIRSDTAWQKVKDTTSKAGSVSLKMLFDVSIALAKKELEEKTGLVLGA